MNRRAWAYIWTVFGIAIGLAAFAAQGVLGSHVHVDWLTLEILLGLAVAAQLFKVEAPNHVLFYATPIFFFAGAILLPPLQLFLLIAVPHVAEWVKERWSGSEYLKAWYLQPFNIGMFWIAGRTAQIVYAALPHHGVDSGWAIAVIMTAAVIYVAMNHTMLGIALVLARGVSWGEAGILDTNSFVSDFVLLCVGTIVAVLWVTRPWFVVPALAPVAFMYQALMIPKLKREAELDAKTGLFNARHFNELFSAELDRAQRFDRPLAVIMADLDHLRDINNQYGHLAGDAVLSGVADVIHATVRDYDVASRFGGEEFALLLPEVDEEQARILAERLRRSVESAGFGVATSNAPLRVSMSLGIACYPNDGRTMTELLHAADTAVYAAKNAGRNRVVCAADMASLALSNGQSQQLLVASPADVPVPTMQLEDLAGGSEPDARKSTRPWVQGVFVGAVIAGGMAALLSAALGSGGASPATVGMLTLLGALAELLEVDIFGQGTVSVSVGVAFTAALLTGVEGLACVSGMIALVHHLQKRRGLNQVHRAFFNWAVHILAGLVVVGGFSLYHLPLRAQNLALLAPTAFTASIGYFLVETGLIAIAVGLARADNPVNTWRKHYGFLLPHYIVLCLMGLALSVTFNELGIAGVIIFALPLVMMHYVQRQHVMQNKENVQALQRMNRDLLRAALHDHLTGLGNERSFQEALRREVNVATDRRLPLVLARLNVDEFRGINEERGRRYGDNLLVEIAHLLAGTSGLQHAYRLVADDFAVILPNTTPTEAITTLGGILEQAPGRLAGATISIGATTIEEDAGDPDLLNEQSHRALAEAKRRGRNMLLTFDAIRENTVLASWSQAQAVRRMLTEKRVGVVFQPIWDIDQESVFGYEALIRPNRGYGLLGPQEAFDVATRIGRARELDTVCREAILARAGDVPKGARLFINVAPESLEDNNLTGPELASAVRAAGLSPEQVVLELTERSMVRPDAIVREAEQLRKYGFGLALDDTGAGNAGLGFLSQLQVDFVKVDRSVVNHAATDQSARAVLAGIFALAHEMGAYVIAEGIESTEMLELVQGMSAMLSLPGEGRGRGVQGYLLGRPNTVVVTNDQTAAATEAAKGAGNLRRFPRVGAPREAAAVGW